VFVLVVAGVVANAFVATPREALLGAGLILLGLPFYLYWNRRARAAALS
jgi:hypothetical protein